jgi:hypothetical protein
MTIRGLLLSLLLTASNTAYSDAVIGTSLNIGYSTDPNSVTGYNSGAFGIGNGVTGGNSVTIGGVNSVWGWYSLAVGWDNQLSNWRSLIVGLSNDSESMDGAIIGANNYIDDDDNKANSSLIVGQYNLNVAAGCSLIVGWNIATEESFASATIGAGLTNTWDYSLVLGRYNADANTVGGRQPLVLIGNGSSSASRSNAMEVYDNGDVTIPKRQGDILMGEFGN